MSKKLLLVEILIGAALSYWVITSFFSSNTKFEELALGTETVSWFATDEDKKSIHIEKINAGERGDFLKGWENRGKKGVILLLGNSQMHSINQIKQGDANFLELIYSKTRNDTVEVLGHSMPNAGLQEYYLAYTYWSKILPVKSVVIPLFMDDMREDGVRDVFFSELILEKYQLRDSTDYLIHKVNGELRRFWSNNPNSKSAEFNADMAALRETFQEKTETYLNSELEDKSRAWANRQNVRGEFFNWMYKLRNTVFDIRANTIR
ncbi:MAG TPA: hypothetical protein PLD02_04555, partial [Saprospiraceae bacterium]|nr:hypothetical protein [Saprospiraceae bacterium]